MRIKSDASKYNLVGGWVGIMEKILRIIFYCTHAIFVSVALSGCSILAYERNYVPETQNSKLIQSSSSK
jgi:hypothetical protein